jgi:4-hydroxy-tetrahydrodipicolinate synthase
MHGILVAGSMGLMQMLHDDTYRELAENAARLWSGKGEILVGVGDVSLVRTLARIQTVTRYRIDGVVAVTPYFFRFSNAELIQYFRALADASPVPLYLYDLPARTGVAIDMPVYEALVQHPNIKGAKISGRLEIARQLLEAFGEKFRVIVAEPDQMDRLVPEGILAHLDGMFAIAPHWVQSIVQAAFRRENDESARSQKKLTELRDLLNAASSPFGAFTVMMNARGISGKFHAAPYADLPNAERDALLATPVMREL